MPGGTIRFYKNIGTNSAPKLDDFVNLTHAGGSTWDKRALEVKLCIDDLNNDGAWDIVFGGELAELYLYVAWGIPDGTKIIKTKNHSSFKNFSIGITGFGAIQLMNNSETKLTYSLFDTKGRTIICNRNIDIKECHTMQSIISKGVYYVYIKENGQYISRKILVK